MTEIFIFSDKTDIESPDSSIITGGGSGPLANTIYYHDIRADNSFHTFNRQKKVTLRTLSDQHYAYLISPVLSAITNWAVLQHQSLIPCGAYSVTQASISSLSPGRGLGLGAESAGHSWARRPHTGPAPGQPPPPPDPDLAGVSYYRYN